MRFAPITTWPAHSPPTPSTERKPSGRFKATLSQTINELDAELTMIGARDAAIEVDVSPRDLRRDGWLYSDARAASPGAVLYYTDAQGQAVTMPCDTFTSMSANLRAIFLTIHNLRLVDTYGVTKGGQQFRGFTALPSSTNVLAMTPLGAAEFLVRATGMEGRHAVPALLTDSNVARDALRSARRTHHPDSGGHHDVFLRVQEAARVLAAHFKVDKL